MPYNIQFKTPFTSILSGMTSSGKTTWIQNLLKIKDQIFTEPPAKIILFYKVIQDLYLEMERQDLFLSLTIQCRS